MEVSHSTGHVLILLKTQASDSQGSLGSTEGVRTQEGRLEAPPPTTTSAMVPIIPLGCEACSWDFMSFLGLSTQAGLVSRRAHGSHCVSSPAPNHCHALPVVAFP